MRSLVSSGKELEIAQKYKKLYNKSLIKKTVAF